MFARSVEPTAEDHSLKEHETVLETSTTGEILIVKSLLESAGLPYFTEGEVLNELFPANTMVTTFNPHYVVAFKVPKEHAEEARDLLAARFDAEELGEEQAEIDDTTAEEPPPDPQAP